MHEFNKKRGLPFREGTHVVKVLEKKMKSKNHVGLTDRSQGREKIETNSQVLNKKKTMKKNNFFFVYRTFRRFYFLLSSTLIYKKKKNIPPPTSPST